MKRLKKLTALVLAACMLIGMPLSLDAAAVGKPNATESELAFQLTQAMLVPASWNTGLDPERSIALYFTGDVTIDLENTTAYITLVNGQGLASHVDPVSGLKNVGTLVSVWDATISQSTALGSVNNYVVTLNKTQTRNSHELLDTVPEILDLAAKTNLNPVVRLRENNDPVANGDTTAQLPNDKVASIYEGTTLLDSTPNGEDGGGCNRNGQVIDTVGTNATDEEKKNGRVTNCYDYVDIAITTLTDAPTVQYVEYDPSVSGNNFRIILNTGLRYSDRGSGNTPTHMRVVNSKGQVIYYNGSEYKTEDQVVTASGITAGYYALGNYNNALTNDHGLNLEKMIAQNTTINTHNLSAVPRASYDTVATTDTLDWKSTYEFCVAARNTLNARNDGETYSVAFVIDENDSSAAYANDRVYAENGESANNWRIDALWTSSYVPLTATHNNPTLGINDRVIVPIISPSEMGDASQNVAGEFYLKNVSVVSSTGYADRVVIEFSKPLSSFAPSYAAIRVYDTNQKVPKHTDGNYIQWQVTEWKQYNASGTRWIGTLNNAFDSNTFAELQEWLVKNSYATNNGTFAMTGGRRLEFAIADAGTDTKNNRRIDRVTATDGSVLFANDSPFGISEERAYIPWNKIDTYDFITIEDLKVYADKYVLIDFSQDVKVDTSLFYNALCVMDTDIGDLAGCNADKTEYGKHTLGTAFQRAFTSFNYYGNRKDIIAATLADGDYKWLVEQMDAANDWSVAEGGNANRFQLRLRLQDYKDKLTPNINYAIQGIYSPHNDYSMLRVKASGDLSTLYCDPTVNGRKIAELTDVTLSAPEQVTVSFSTEIHAVDASAFTLVNTDTNATYQASKATVNGTAAVVTFPGAVFDENMIIRISGGNDYTLPDSVIATVDGTAIYANETASTAILKANISDAVAAAKVDGVPYVYFANAWATKKPGSTVTLYGDVNYDDLLVVSADVTFDLNGHVFTTPDIISFGNVVDSQNGVGLLRIDKDVPGTIVMLQPENTLLPLYDISKPGYRFFTYDIVNRGKKEIKDGDTVTALLYGIKLDFSNTDAYKLLRDPVNTDISLTFNLTIRRPHSYALTTIYGFPNWALRDYANAVLNSTGNTLLVTVYGIDDVAAQVQSLPMSATIDADSSITSGTGVTHDSTNEIYHVGITPAQAAFKWIDERITNNDLISFDHKHTNGEDMSDLGDLRYWTAPTITTTDPYYDAAHDWTRKISYTNKLLGELTLTLDVSFNAEHASIEWVGSWNWKQTSTSRSQYYSNPISNVRILNADFTVNNAVMTTARQGGMNYIHDFQPYSVDLTETPNYTMQNVGGRSSQSAWPYFDLTSAHNTYGIMGAIGWSGNWMCNFTNNGDGTVHVEAGMQNTNYQMKNGETLRTPSMVIQFFKGTQDDGHNAWRQLVLDNYTPNDVNDEPVRYAPITINTWGGRGSAELLKTMNDIQSTGQYFEYQWIDAGWYGDYTSENTYDETWSNQLGNWYYNPGYPSTNNAKTAGGFNELKTWHAENGTSLLVWFEPGRALASTVMGITASSSSPYKFSATYKQPQADGTLKQVTDEIVSWNNTYFLRDTSFVNYGNANGLKYIKAVVLHYLDDMGCTFYRQDYNFDPVGGWVNQDNYDIGETTGVHPVTGNNISLRERLLDEIPDLDYRTGVSEIKYVMGHYELLDAIIASGRQIDNCASGGRLLDIEMAKRSIPLWRTDYTVSEEGVKTVASGIRSQGANLAWWLPISGGNGSSEGNGNEYGFRSYMASGATMGKLNSDFANKMIPEMLHNRELMLGDYYILQQGLHEGLEYTTDPHPKRNILCWYSTDNTKDFTDTTDAAYEFYCSDPESERYGEGYLVTFRPNHSTKTTQTYKLKGLDAHADYLVEDADTGETFTCTGRYLMERGITVESPKPRTSHMIYFTKQQ